MAHLQARKIEHVRDASGSGGGRVDAVDCGPFLADAGAAVARHRGHNQWPVLATVLAASRERPEQVRWYTVVQSLQSHILRMFAVKMF